MTPIIDAHLDLAWNALSFDRDIASSAASINAGEQRMTDCQAREHATVGLPDMRRGQIAVCLGTLLARARSTAQSDSRTASNQSGSRVNRDCPLDGSRSTGIL